MVSQNQVIVSDRFQIYEELGRGYWGRVFRAYDRDLEQDVAIKVFDPKEAALKQMTTRGLTLEEAMRKEGAKLGACSNVVPRGLYWDVKGRPFIVMPRYPKNFAEILLENSERVSLGEGLTYHTAVQYLKDIANGLKEIHTVLDLVHSDVRPENIVVDDHERLLLTDFSTATYAGNTDASRSNMGFDKTRAYECFSRHPDKRSDVWAFGSLAYRLFTGKYILENELDNAMDRMQYVHDISEEVANVLVRQKLRNRKIPKSFRGFLEKCLVYDPQSRFQDGTELSRGLEKTIARNASPLWRKVALSAALVGAFAGSGYFLLRQNRSIDQLNKTHQELKLEENLQLIRVDYDLFVRSKTTNSPSQLSLASVDSFARSSYPLSRIEAYAQIFEDRRVAYLAFMDLIGFMQILRDFDVKKIKDGKNVYDYDLIKECITIAPFNDQKFPILYETILNISYLSDNKLLNNYHSDVSKEIENEKESLKFWLHDIEEIKVFNAPRIEDLNEKIKNTTSSIQDSIQDYRKSLKEFFSILGSKQESGLSPSE